MATERTNQEARSTAGDQRDYSSENESKPMTQDSQNNQVDRSNTGSQGAINQPQNQPASQETGEKSSAPRVKLDMDLDVELQLKAKIQGDLELAILEN